MVLGRSNCACRQYPHHRQPPTWNRRGSVTRAPADRPGGGVAIRPKVHHPTSQGRPRASGGGDEAAEAGQKHPNHERFGRAPGAARQASRRGRSRRSGSRQFRVAVQMKRPEPSWLSWLVLIPPRGSPPNGRGDGRLGRASGRRGRSRLGLSRRTGATASRPRRPSVHVIIETDVIRSAHRMRPQPANHRGGHRRSRCLRGRRSRSMSPAGTASDADCA